MNIFDKEERSTLVKIKVTSLNVSIRLSFFITGRVRACKLLVYTHAQTHTHTHTVVYSKARAKNKTFILYYIDILTTCVV